MDGNTSWLTPDDTSIYELLRLTLFELRKSYLSEGEQEWSGCSFVLDLQTGKFEMNLKYQD